MELFVGTLMQKFLLLAKALLWTEEILLIYDSKIFFYKYLNIICLFICLCAIHMS